MRIRETGFIVGGRVRDVREDGEEALTGPERGIEIRRALQRAVGLFDADDLCAVAAAEIHLADGLSDGVDGHQQALDDVLAHR